ncbi:MAG: trigger factor [Syntrophus sp. (in: bacteria)]|nr:trigger factor [Syntrophus sp. (in: bacteria)]
MKVQVETLDSVRKKVEVLLPVETVDGIREAIYNEVKRNAKIKGFRPGKIPRPIITQYYKDYIDEESKKKMVENTMYAALLEAKVEPVMEPIVEFLEKEGETGYTLECEVMPEIELPLYKGIEIEIEQVAVSDEDVDKRVEGLQQMHAEIIPKSEGAVAESGDFVVIKYQGYHNGEPVKEVMAEAYPLELGNARLMPEFEAALVGMKENEEKDIEMPFPEDYPDKSIASKTLIFKVTVKEIKQKKLPPVNDDFAKDLNYDSTDALKEGTKAELLKEKENNRQREITQKIMETMLKDLEVPVPKRLLEKRLEGMIEETASRYQSGKLSEEEMASIKERMREEFGKRAEDRLKVEMLLAQIGEKEGITADDKDVEEQIKKIAEETNKTYNEVKNIYEQYNLMGGLKSTIIEEKTISFLKESAVIKEKA